MASQVHDERPESARIKGALDYFRVDRIAQITVQWIAANAECALSEAGS
jgi:hypothetical protein